MSIGEETSALLQRESGMPLASSTTTSPSMMHESSGGAYTARAISGRPRVVVAVAREEQCLAASLAGEQSIAIELELEEPAVARERLVRLLGEHDVRGLGIEACAASSSRVPSGRCWRAVRRT
jgi:hypothetical protein